jgi:hypothetical protein
MVVIVNPRPVNVRVRVVHVRVRHVVVAVEGLFTLPDSLARFAHKPSTISLKSESFRLLIAIRGDKLILIV